MTNIIHISSAEANSVNQPMQHILFCFVSSINRKHFSMKNNLMPNGRLIACIAGCFILVSCVTNVITGQTVKETRDVSGFSEVALSFSGDVFITQGNQFKVEVEADKNVMDVLITEIDGNTLVLKTKNGVWRNLGDVNVYITMPDIDRLSIAGSGDMVCESAVKSDEIELAISGSGSLRIANLSAREISAEVTGSGDIIVNGSGADNAELDATITGSGNIKAEGLAVSEATVKITGSGSAAVNVLKELETKITGSGSVNYKGNPLVNASATGSGRTRSMN
jgi:hypothetical protein